MNGCIRDEQTTTWFVPDEIRTIRTPLPVLKYGRSDSCFASKTIRNRPDMEFCLRISSREAAAEDTVNGRRCRTPYPHVMLKLPGQEHTTSCTNPRHVFFFHYDRFAPDILRGRSVPVDELFWPFAWSDALEKMIEEMMAHAGSLHSPGVPERVDALAWRILLECCLRRSGAAGPPPDRREKEIRAIASYLQLHSREEIDLESLIARHGFSRRSFFRHWAKHYRESPTEMVRNLRLRQAEELLLKTDLSVSEISADLNFRYSEYFIRAFKAATGQTPLQFREKPE